MIRSVVSNGSFTGFRRELLNLLATYWTHTAWITRLWWRMRKITIRKRGDSSEQKFVNLWAFQNSSTFIWSSENLILKIWAGQNVIQMMNKRRNILCKCWGRILFIYSVRNLIFKCPYDHYFAIENNIVYRLLQDFLRLRTKDVS